jgi:hypothetical protein
VEDQPQRARVPVLGAVARGRLDLWAEEPWGCRAALLPSAWAVGVCARVCASVSAHVCACVRACVRACMRARACANALPLGRCRRSTAWRLAQSAPPAASEAASLCGLSPAPTPGLSPNCSEAGRFAVAG